MRRMREEEERREEEEDRKNRMEVRPCVQTAPY
jgi:hypothetical protein